jgi:hypothetical protein
MLQVHVFWDRTVPPEFSVFSPAAQTLEPTLIGGCGFRVLKQFMLFHKYRQADPDYAQLFTSEHEPELERAYAAVQAKLHTHASDYNPNPNASLNTMLDFMQKDEAYLAFQNKVFSPIAATFFKGLNDGLRERGAELMKLWVEHRFGHLCQSHETDAVSFVSEQFTSYAAALTDLFCGPALKPSLDARMLTRLLSKQPCLLDLVFGGSSSRNIDQARRRRLLPEQADCPFRRLRSLLT